MSVKHIKSEYQRICKDYHEMLESIHDLEEAVSEKAISPEAFEELMKPLEIMKTNYMRWSYIMYLLDMPNKKSKKKQYEKSHSYITSDQSEHEENIEAIKKFDSSVKEI